MRILIAEGDFTSSNILAAVLSKAGHEGDKTANSAGACRNQGSSIVEGVLLLQ